MGPKREVQCLLAAPLVLASTCRQIAVNPNLSRMQNPLAYQRAPAGATGGTGGEDTGTAKPKSKTKKEVPVTKKVATNISTCSSKLTELMTWESKVKDSSLCLGTMREMM